MLKFYKYHDWVEGVIIEYICEKICDIDYSHIIKDIKDLTSVELFNQLLSTGLLYYLAQNPSDVAMEIINQNIEKIENSIDNKDVLFSKDVLLKSTLANLCYNTNDIAIDILEKYKKDIYEIQFKCLNHNTNNKAVELCKKETKIDMLYLSSNPSDAALDILCDNIDEISWCEFSSNSNDRAVELLKQNPEKIDWSYLSRNSNDKVYDWLRENPDKISWLDLLVNKNSRILGLYDDNMDKMKNHCWKILCENNCDKALEILEANQDKIHWDVLANNNNDKAIKLLSGNMEKLIGKVPSLAKNTNPKAFDLIMKKYINWPPFTAWLMSNPNIFVYNYEAIRQHMGDTWLPELLKYWHHPKNMHKWIQWGWDDCPDLDNFGL